MELCKKFKLFMWKNLLIQIRHPMQTFVEILLPIMFILFIIYMRSNSLPSYNQKEKIFNTILPLKIKDWSKEVSNYKHEVVYSPSPNYYPDDDLSKVKEYVKISKVGYKTMEEVYKHFEDKNSLVAVIFDIHHYPLNKVPHYGIYHIIVQRFPSELRSYVNDYHINNWKTNLLYPIFPFTGPREPHEINSGSSPEYYEEGFIQIQFGTFIGIDKALIDKDLVYNSVKMQRFPYPAHTKDPFLGEMQMILSFFILLGYVCTSVNTVRFITVEKEKKLTETMKKLGISCALQWFAWFVRTMVLLAISSVFIIISFKIHPSANSKASVLTYSSTTTLAAFFLIYSMATTAFCIMMSAFFTKAKMASNMTGVVWLMIYLPYMVTQNTYRDRGFLFKLLICLFHNSAMGLHFKMLIMHEGTDEGLQWNNLFKPVSSFDDFSIGFVWIMLICDIFLYLFIAINVERIKSGYVQLPWYYAFKKKFWTNNCYIEVFEDKTNLSEEQNNDNMEPELGPKYAAIQIKNLRKIYRNKVAVHGLTLNMYEDQITVLLGNSGAGKSTTLYMLAGMLSPSSGTAIINGKELGTDTNNLNLNSLVLCHQDNILFDELTAREHIIFFSKLRGVKNSEIIKDIAKYDSLLDLESDTNAQVSTLLNGMKRKLAIAVALCGGSKVVLCDEPTLGMDPLAQRTLWNVLQQEKQGRTIIVSTKFADEAEFLGDRIAIMSAGELKCCGTSFYLKKKLGVGYHLICTKSENCRTKKIKKILNKYVPSSILECEADPELSYQVSELYRMNFPKMLIALEDHQIKLGISSYRLSFTTLEEVFMSVANNVSDETTEIYKNNSPEVNADGKCFSIETESESVQVFIYNYVSLITNQIEAMILKKKFYACNTCSLSVIQILIPFVFVLMAFSVVQSLLGGSILPPMHLNHSSYLKSIAVIYIDPNLSSKSLEYKIGQSYINIIEESPASSIDVVYEDINNYMLKLQKKSLTLANEQYLFGLTIKAGSFVVHYSNQGYHIGAVALSLYQNAAIRANYTSSYMFTINHPYPYKESSRIEMIKNGHTFGYILAINIGISMALVSAFYVIFYIKERESRSKFLQFVSGVNVFIFWLIAFIWDLLSFAITSLVIICTLFLIEEEGFSTVEELGRCYLLLLAFGWATLPLHYLASDIFTEPSSGFTWMILFNLFTGVAIFISDIIREFGMFFPHFLLTEGFNHLNSISSYNRLCNEACERENSACTMKYLCSTKNKTHCCDLDYINSPNTGIMKNIITLIGVGLILFVLVLIKDIFFYKFVTCCSRKKKKVNTFDKKNLSIDDDVLAEKKKVAQMNHEEIKNYNLVIQDLTKFNKSSLAINDLSVAINHSECFGIFGMNFAGKTTVLKVLVGDIKLSSGNAWVFGKSINNEIHHAYREVGYCPQVDALIDDLTGRETLNIFCLIRGVERSKIKKFSLNLAIELNFLNEIDKRVSEYSDENKRKLSIVLALIGGPSVVYLDEATNGMDLGSKRLLWNIINRIRYSGKSIILGSSSIDECEALCTRLAVMINGELKCIGSSQHLKHKYSSGFTLTIKPFNLMQSDICTCGEISNKQKLIIDQVKDYINLRFPEATLKDESNEFLTYFVSGTMKWPIMFAIVETAKCNVQIEDYIIINPSFGEVLLGFNHKASRKRLIRC